LPFAGFFEGRPRLLSASPINRIGAQVFLLYAFSFETLAWRRFHEKPAFPFALAALESGA
jgi:hypothetical protein